LRLSKTPSVATDGVFDNLNNQDILKLVTSRMIMTGAWTATESSPCCICTFVTDASRGKSSKNAPPKTDAWARIRGVQMQHGDVLMVATDGVFDNLNNQDILKLVTSRMIFSETPTPDSVAVHAPVIIIRLVTSLRIS
jgi:serine/threonine protein phosphatase PrpC